MIKGSCHCGTVTYQILETPEFVIACNCSICRKLNTRWAYSHRTKMTLDATNGSTHIYQMGRQRPRVPPLQNLRLHHPLDGDGRLPLRGKRPIGERGGYGGRQSQAV